LNSNCETANRLKFELCAVRQRIDTMVNVMIAYAKTY